MKSSLTLTTLSSPSQVYNTEFPEGRMTHKHVTETVAPVCIFLFYCVADGSGPITAYRVWAQDSILM